MRNRDHENEKLKNKEDWYRNQLSTRKSLLKTPSETPTYLQDLKVTSLHSTIFQFPKASNDKEDNNLLTATF